ncbi:MAG: pentapeptide repeat-containing protein [Planctomycetota bacterium]|jgi:uncharacterized protein YjbI with pentapeptide repeats
MSGEILPLGDLLESPPRSGVVALLGPRGAGKSVALRYLAERWPGVRVVDDPPPGGIVAAAPFVYAADEPLKDVAHKLMLTLAPWTDDELLEYLLAAHKDRCKQVMARLMAARDRDLPKGSPELWHEVLDAMAADDALVDVGAALRVAHAGVAARAGAIALDWPRARARSLLAGSGWDDRRERLMRHRPVQVAWAVAEILRRLEIGDRTFPERMPAPDVVEAAGPAIARSDAARSALAARVDEPKQQAAAASLLHAAGIAWRPSPGALLAGSRLAGVSWRGVDLTGACLRRADLSRADLAEATLDGVEAFRAVLRRVNLHGAALRGLNGRGAELSHADLSHTRAEGANFFRADLTGADLSGALLRRARFGGARLRRASLVRADLARASLLHADVAGADLAGACLDDVMMPGIRLSAAASVRGASFRRARLRDAHLGGIELPGGMLEKAWLHNADLTGARMPDARLACADLSGARAAHVCWEGADLREADLSRVNFHMGSSRSGLVDSTIASEGTRTGFYTDDYDEQHFKAPEDIRKANLCGADLRGAVLADTDFYLVDLRRARYTRDQARHFRRCGAIL